MVSSWSDLRSQPSPLKGLFDLLSRAEGRSLRQHSPQIRKSRFWSRTKWAFLNKSPVVAQPGWFLFLAFWNDQRRKAEHFPTHSVRPQFKKTYRGIWLAPSVKHPTLAQSWSHGLWVRALCQALCWQLRAWSLLWILCFPLSLSFPCSHCLSLSLKKWINGKKKKKKKFKNK